MDFVQPAQSVSLGLLMYIVPKSVPRRYFVCLWIIMDFLPCIIKWHGGKYGQFRLLGLPGLGGLLVGGSCRILGRERQ